MIRGDEPYCDRCGMGELYSCLTRDIDGGVGRGATILLLLEMPRNTLRARLLFDKFG